MPVGIENDAITGGTRVFSSHGGQTILDWQRPRPPIDLAGSWVNVDGRLGVIMLAGAGITYAQASGYSPGISVYADILYGSNSGISRQFQAGEEVAHRVAIVSVEVTPEETLELVQSCKIEEKPGGHVLHFKQPDAKNAEMTPYKLL